jgi:hypothetical protein
MCLGNDSTEKLETDMFQLSLLNLGIYMTAYYAHELSDESIKAIRDAQPSKEAEVLNYLL